MKVLDILPQVNKIHYQKIQFQITHVVFSVTPELAGGVEVPTPLVLMDDTDSRPGSQVGIDTVTITI